MAEGDIIVIVQATEAKISRQERLGLLGKAGASSFIKEVGISEHTHGGELHTSLKLPGKREGTMKKFARSLKSRGVSYETYRISGGEKVVHQL